VYDNPGDQT
jgi:hypothetical protein